MNFGLLEALDGGCEKRVLTDTKYRNWPIVSVDLLGSPSDPEQLLAGDMTVGHVPRNAIARAEAAVLACGEDAALSFSASLALWDLGEWPVIMEVTAPRERRRPGIRCHCSRSLSGRDVRRRHGIRTTSPFRTIADMAPRLTDAQLIRLINDARLANLLHPSALSHLYARCSRARRLLGDNQRPTVQSSRTASARS